MHLYIFTQLSNYYLKLVSIYLNLKYFVSGPPYVHPIPELKAVVGKEFSFMCPASGYPIDRISWSKGKLEHFKAFILILDV